MLCLRSVVIIVTLVEPSPLSRKITACFLFSSCCVSRHGIVY